jgi:ParB/RepB/Spo0J family partition protein
MRHDQSSRSPIVPGSIDFVLVDDLDPNPYQPRLRPHTEASLGDLIPDMREFGFRAAIQVRKNPHDPAGRPQIVAGHRRVAAAKIVGIKKIPVQFVDLTNEQMEQSALRENLLREDLTPWEEAVALGRLRNRGMTYHQIAAFVGKSVGWVQNRLTLLQTEGALREAAMAHPELLTAINTLMLLDPADRESLFERVRKGELNVEDLRALVRAKRDGLRWLASTVPPREARSTEVAHEQPVVRTGQPATTTTVTDDAGATPLAVVRENPADNPEGQAVGLTVDNGVDGWDDVAAQPTDRATARRLATDLPLGESPTGPVLRLLTPAESSPDEATAPLPDEHWRAANAEMLRYAEAFVVGLRTRVEQTSPRRYTAAERRRFRQLRQDIVDILVVVT